LRHWPTNAAMENGFMAFGYDSACAERRVNTKPRGALED
jgi:hypothetical protein